MSRVDDALHVLFDAHRLLRDAGEQVAGQAGQTHARRMVLQASGDGASVAEIARTLGLQRQGVQRITDALVAEGLACYVENPRHRLSKLFIPTDAGAAVLSEIHRSHAQWVEQLEARATGLDWRALHDELSKVVDVLRRTQRSER